MLKQAEVGTDLWQVFLGDGSDEYRDPVEFYRRTFITEVLQKMLCARSRKTAEC